MPVSVEADSMLADFGLRLREARLKRGMSITEAAAVSGMSYTVIYCIENEGRLPNSATLVRLCLLLDVSADSLLGIDKKAGL